MYHRPVLSSSSCLHTVAVSHFASSAFRSRYLRLSRTTSTLPSRTRRQRSRPCYCLSSSLKNDIRVLKRELSNAVDEEDYFRAASLRDEILDLEDKDPVLCMKKQLTQAIDVEDYETAAQLRDSLTDMLAKEMGQMNAVALTIEPIACQSDVLTRGIRVRVRSFYVEHLSAAAQGKYVFAYQVEITNEGEETVQLKNRSWTIVDGRGNVEYASGPGVIGQQPILGPGRYFQYMSICPLETTVGTMEGHYEMVVLSRHSQQTFFASIGKFGLNVDMHHRQYKD